MTNSSTLLSSWNNERSDGFIFSAQEVIEKAIICLLKLKVAHHIIQNIGWTKVGSRGIGIE